MRIIWFMMKFALTIIGLLALIQFFWMLFENIWMLFENKRNGFIADLGVTIRDWYSEAISFVLGNSDNKPFP